MAFISSIIVVEDIPRSRQLYEGILHLKVTADFGIYNVGFEGGLSLYRKAFFEEIAGVQADLLTHHQVVLYFEIDDIEGLEKEIVEQGFEFVHRIREQPWKQRNFRFYDYDNHILEVAEKMDMVFRRLVEEGWTVEDMARVTGYPPGEVMKVLERLKEQA